MLCDLRARRSTELQPYRGVVARTKCGEGSRHPGNFTDVRPMYARWWTTYVLDPPALDRPLISRWGSDPPELNGVRGKAAGKLGDPILGLDC